MVPTVERTRTTKRLTAGDVLMVGDVLIRVADQGPQRVYLDIESDQEIRIVRAPNATSDEM